MDTDCGDQESYETLRRDREHFKNQNRINYLESQVWRFKYENLNTRKFLDEAEKLIESLKIENEKLRNERDSLIDDLSKLTKNNKSITKED